MNDQSWKYLYNLPVLLPLEFGLSHNQHTNKQKFIVRSFGLLLFLEFFF